MSKQVEDTTGQSIQTMSVNAPMTVIGVANEVNWTLNIAAIPDERRNDIVAGLLRQGALIIAQRGGSGKDLAERRKATTEAMRKLQDGTYSFGAGGGGPRLTPEQDAWIEFLKADGEKSISGKTLRDVQLGRCAAALIKKGTATKETALEMAKGEVDKWIEFMETKRPALAALIAAKRALAQGIVADDEDY